MTGSAVLTKSKMNPEGLTPGLRNRWPGTNKARIVKDIPAGVRYAGLRDTFFAGPSSGTGNARTFMNGRNGMHRPEGGRFQWGSFGFFSGILLGVLLGWFFAGFVGAFIRIVMVALVFVPVVLAYLGWRRYIAPWLRPAAESQYAEPVNAIETRGVVHGGVPDPRAR